MMDHPSNVLYRGECSDIEQALALVIAELKYEATLNLGFNDAEAERFASTLNDDIASVEKLRSEYYARVNAVRDELMTQWETRDGWARGFAEAYRNSDYTGLAI